MREPAMLYEPIIEVRDVLESFLADDIVLADWQDTLSAASVRLFELGVAWSDPDVVELSRMTRQLAGEGLTGDLSLARLAANNVARLLENVRIPGVPRPEDDNWAF
ncbi:hypothetical protein [Mycobacterium riyadhense]|uniref:Uncharacterized protein n=1 Tax=Mycobacterium riyadhense TaxID=486698 RepID=A0A1X2BF88_9MYCO|nr:hypothetical protein [Mycobacterium riyadhense]MCV7148783.1 hypothetical protein [Mycobacterium riyadhense]ORW61909.1 hypothetical protein AWC22_04605 [Mycobacterium riyadhense]